MHIRMDEPGKPATAPRQAATVHKPQIGNQLPSLPIPCSQAVSVFLSLSLMRKDLCLASLRARLISTPHCFRG